MAWVFGLPVLREHYHPCLKIIASPLFAGCTLLSRGVSHSLHYADALTAPTRVEGFNASLRGVCSDSVYTSTSVNANLLPSNSPLSLSFNEGMTSKAMKDSVINGACNGEPRLRTILLRCV